MPYSSAQLINHPARGIQPNVYFHDFNWTQYLAYTKENDPSINAEEENKKITKVCFFFKKDFCSVFAGYHVWSDARKISCV